MPLSAAGAPGFTMTVVRPNLTGKPERGRKNVTYADTGEVRDVFFVQGPAGTVEVGWFDTRKIIGRRVCSGVTWHGRYPWGSAEHMEDCDWLTGDHGCYGDTWNAATLHDKLDVLLDDNDEVAIWGWLETFYNQMERDQKRARS